MTLIEGLIETISPIKHFTSRLLNKEVLEVSLILTTTLRFLGLDLFISQFILILVVVDLLTKWYSLVVAKYKSFNLSNLLRAFNSGIINSNSLRKGIYGKVVMYLVLIFVAASISREDISDKVLFAEFVSQFIYSTLIVSEVLSILENYRDCGYGIANMLLKLVSKKASEALDYDVEELSSHIDNNSKDIKP